MINYLKDGYSTLSLGYIGIYEITKLMKGVSQTTPEGHEFAIRVMNYLKDRTTEMEEMNQDLGFCIIWNTSRKLML